MKTEEEDIVNTKSIMAKLDNIKDLPTIPPVLYEVNKMLRDEDVSIKKMGDIIEADQVLASRILKLVNSAFYGFRSKIVDIRQAVMILGFNMVRNALSAVSVIDLFRAKEKYGGFDIRELWKHSAAVAVTGKYLAERGRIALPADSFVAGLLHDIGKLIMAEHFADIFKRVLESTREGNISFIEAERKISSVDHALIGGCVAQKWQLPGRLTEAIMYHHKVNRNAGDLWLQVSVYAANTIVNQNFTGNVYEELPGSCPEFSEVLPRLGRLSELHPAIEDEIEQLSHIFLEDDSL